jgi:hypothetical protein
MTVGRAGWQFVRLHGLAQAGRARSRRPRATFIIVADTPGRAACWQAAHRPRDGDENDRSTASTSDGLGGRCHRLHRNPGEPGHTGGHRYAMLATIENIVSNVELDIPSSSDLACGIGTSKPSRPGSPVAVGLGLPGPIGVGRKAVGQSGQCHLRPGEILPGDARGRRPGQGDVLVRHGPLSGTPQCRRFCKLRRWGLKLPPLFG